MDETGTLVLAGTPIGDAADASPALLRALLAADVIAAEDTRKFRGLTTRLGIEVTAKVVSFFDGNESGRVPGLIADLKAGRRVLVVTDAGMPSVSDPGYRLVAAAVEAGLPVTSVPGPSAVTTALAVSGLASDRFCFEGFLPRKGGERRSRLTELATEPRTMVFFEAPHRLDDFLADAATVLGADRPAAVCRELTKTYEEVRRGPLGDLAAWAAAGVRGEITVVIAGAPARTASLAEAIEEVRARVERGERFSEAATAVAELLGLPRRRVYDAALKART